MWGFKTALELTLWSDEYTEFVVAAKERCQALGNKPASELSVQDEMDILNGSR